MSKNKKTTKTALKSAAPRPLTYHEKIYHSQDLKNVLDDFFTNLPALKSGDIGDFLNALSRRSDANIPAGYLQKLQRKINELAVAESDKPNLAEIGIILNSLAGLKYKKSDLPELNIRNLVQIFNADENANGRNMLGLLNGCARLGFDKSELEFDSEKLSGTINLEFATLHTSQKINLLNSLTKIGYDEKNETLLPAILKTVHEAIKEVRTLDGKDIAALIHSCAKMGIYDEVFAVQEELTKALTPEKISQLSSQSAFSLLQTQMFCEIDFEQGFFEPEMLEAISQRYVLKSDPISKLQNSIAKTLEKHGYNVLQEQSVYKVNGISTRDVDIIATKTIGGEKKSFYIEVDGDSHYLRSSHIVDSATEKRDHFNKEAIALRDSITKSFYLTLPYYDLEAIQQRPEDFLSQGVEIESRSYEASLSAALSEVKVAPTTTELAASSTIRAKPHRKVKAKVEKVAVQSEAKEEVVVTNFETAIRTNNLKAVVKAISDGEDVNQSLSSGKTVFDDVLERSFRSAKFPNRDFSRILNILINAGAEVRSSEILSSENPQIQEKLSILSQDAQLNGLESLACALIKFSSANSRGDELTTAVRSNSLNVVDALIESGRFDPTSKDAANAINLAVANVLERKGEIKILASLINNGHVNSNLIRRDISEASLKELLNRSLEDCCAEIFIPLVTQNNLSRDFLFGSSSQVEDFTILHYAAFFGNTNIVEFLTDLKNPCAVDAKEILGSRTPIMAAIDGGHLETIKYLIEEKNIDPNQISAVGFTPIIRATMSANRDAISYLISRGADINFYVDPKKFDQKFSSFLDKYGIQPIAIPDPITMASIAGNSDLIPFLVAKGANTYAIVNGKKISSVNAAINHGNATFLSNLIDGGLDVVSRQFFRGEIVSPLEVAIELTNSGAIPKRQDSEIAVLLLSNGANPNEKLFYDEGSTIFHYAISTVNFPINIIKSMIELGKADCVGTTPETLFNGKITPIQLVAGKEKKDQGPLDAIIAKLLINNGANPNQEMTNGATLVIWAVQTGNLRMLQTLHQAGADITNKQGHFQETPLEHLVDGGNKYPEIATYLKANATQQPLTSPSSSKAKVVVTEPGKNISKSNNPG